MDKKYDLYDSIFDYLFDQEIDRLEAKERESQKEENCKLSADVNALQKEFSELKQKTL